MLRLLEHYPSPQGEGPRVGIMTQFVRFAGCNLKCPGWPCDTPQAIDPKLFQKEQQHVHPADLFKSIARMAIETGALNVCFTGGEPMMQDQDYLAALIDTLRTDTFSFECFTNGTRPIQTPLMSRMAFIMDWKLPGSGEDPFNEQRLKNVELLDLPINSVKFVIARPNDLIVAQDLWRKHLRYRDIQVFVGAAWGKFDNEVIVDYIKENQLPWRLNVQVHNYLFGAHRRFI
jgi:7-carboxy-7-deazaguanine synthase